MTQLKLLLQFQKDESLEFSNIQGASPDPEPELEALSPLPLIKRFVSAIISFRTGLSRDDLFGTTPGGKFTFKSNSSSG